MFPPHLLRALCGSSLVLVFGCLPSSFSFFSKVSAVLSDLLSFSRHLLCWPASCCAPSASSQEASREQVAPKPGGAWSLTSLLCTGDVEPSCLLDHLKMLGSDILFVCVAVVSSSFLYNSGTLKVCYLCHYCLPITFNLLSLFWSAEVLGFSVVRFINI